jgi:hypothetical protein
MSPERALQNSRRSFMKLLAAAPLFVSLGARSLASTVAASAAGIIPTSPRDWNNNIYTRFGIRPIINCRGVYTYLTASVELPQVRKAAEEASHFFIDIYELHDQVGSYLAKMSGAEYGNRPPEEGSSGQALLPLLRARRHTCSAPSRQILERSIQGKIRQGLGCLS